MLIIGPKRYINTSFDSEQELEQVVANYSDFFFGPNSIFLSKTLIRTADGFGTIPDAYAIDIDQRRWFVVEVELLSHNVWNHIAPQVARQVIAANQPGTRDRLIKKVIELYKDDNSVKTAFENAGIPEIDTHGLLRDIMHSKPIIGLPIDAVTQDLREWAQTLNTEVKLWVVRKFVAFDFPDETLYELPDDFMPALDTVASNTSAADSFAQTGALVSSGNRGSFDISISDLVTAGLLSVGERLVMTYGPRGRARQNFGGTIESDGSLVVDNRKFTSPSYAAVYCMQKAGSTQRTANGWIIWKNGNGEFLSDLRNKYVNRQP